MSALSVSVKSGERACALLAASVHAVAAGAVRTAEQIAARAANAFKYALCTMHADRSANALRVVWYKGTGGRAERVVGGVAARVGVASDVGSQPCGEHASVSLPDAGAGKADGVFGCSLFSLSLSPGSAIVVSILYKAQKTRSHTAGLTRVHG